MADEAQAVLRQTVNFRAFYMSRTLYVFTEQLIGVSIPIIVFRDTESATLTALVFFVIWAPRCLFPIVAWRIIDARNPKAQMRVVDGVRIAILLMFVVLPVGELLLVGVGLLSLLNLWAIALFEKGLQFATPVTSKEPRTSQDDVEKFSHALGADRVALTASALISGIFLGLDDAELLHVGAALTLAFAHVLQERSRILRPIESEKALSYTSLWSTAQFVFRNNSLRRLLYLMWLLNGLQGAVFSALPMLAVDLFGQNAVVSAWILTVLHMMSWFTLKSYCRLAKYISLERRLSFAMWLFCITLVLAFVTQSFFVFLFCVCISFSIRNLLDVETIIERNRHLLRGHFGQVMAVFLPLVYLPFAISGLGVGGMFAFGHGELLPILLVASSAAALAVWIASLSAAFGTTAINDQSRPIRGGNEVARTARRNKGP